MQDGKNQLPTRLYIIFLVHPSRQPARNTKYQIPPPPKKNTQKKHRNGRVSIQRSSDSHLFFLKGGGTSPRETSLLVRCQLSKLQKMLLNSNSVEVSGGLTGENRNFCMDEMDEMDGWMDGTLMKNYVLQNIVILMNN